MTSSSRRALRDPEDTSAMRRKTPMMAQYLAIKEQHRDAILLFRMGDFYETFYDDARIAAEVLGVALTTRDRNAPEPVPLAGVPHHSVDTYVARLLRAGYKVAICEQIEDPATARGLVKRAVTEVLTPGTALTPELLPPREPHYVLALVPAGESPSDTLGFAFLDVSTGEFGLGERSGADTGDVVARYAPGELVVPQACMGSDWERQLRQRFEGLPITHVEDTLFDDAVAHPALKRHFGVHSLAGLDCGDLPRGTRAGGALLEHVGRLKQARLDAVTRLHVVRDRQEMFLDEDTLGHLEIFRPLRGTDPSVTLVHHLDQCRTPMGSRMLRRWLRAPLRDPAAASARLDAVAALVNDREQRELLRQTLRRIGDLERAMGRVAADRAGPRDVLALAESLETLPEVREVMGDPEPVLLQELRDQMDPLADVAAHIRATLVDEPPAHLREGGVIRPGVSEELDTLLESTREARTWISGLQESQRQATGIAKLKVGYNKVFGYYLEVPRGQLARVPETWIAKQTLVNAQRYVTPELKEKEQIVLRAEAERARIETALFGTLRREIAAHAARVHRSAAAVAQVDALAAFAEVAWKHEYVRPQLDGGDVIRIRGGRHPVVERRVETPFVPNDVDLGGEGARIVLLTGPNMGGKSTFLRQVALIVLMAHAGCFVPAEHAQIGRVDRIFTRVGASDNLARGQSTFLVEMIETARILHACTDHSLVILDEVGRGTSTHDGMSLAWAILEHLHHGDGPHPRTLFATHYHELTVLEDSLPHLRNLTVDVKEWQDEILFLHRVRPGRADKSYGIQVARLAGLPRPVLERAATLLERHERMENSLGRTSSADRDAATRPAGGPPPRQLDLFAAAEREVARRLRATDPEALDAEEARALLAALRALL